MRKLKELKDKLDISKSDYKVNKWIFRSAALLILFLIVVVGFIDGAAILFGGSVGMCCHELGGCHNPFYSPLSTDPMMKDQIILYGECVGEEPSLLAQNLGSISIFLVIGSFLLNHGLFNLNYFSERGGRE